MACNCINEVEKNVLAKVAEINPTYTITDGDFDNKIWSFGDHQGVILTHKYEYHFTKVNGTQSNTRKGKINVNPIYCGFCGVKFIEDAKV